jgi:hypothetical protein
MKKTITTIGAFLITLSLCGCQSPQTVQPPIAPDIQNNNNGRTFGYKPKKIKITPLTKFVIDESEEISQLQLYIDVLDEFDSRIKAPVVFRFELYEYVPRSGEEKGKRISIWPDIDLTGPANNNEYWRDFLRCYQFTLDLEEQIEEDSSFVLQATCITTAGKRLTADFIIEYK